jgi:hypothetical protein
VTVKEQLAPEVDCTVTVVSPTGKKVFEVGEAVIVPQLPEKSESNVTRVPRTVFWVVLAGLVMFPGHISVQAPVSPALVITALAIEELSSG